MRPNPYKPYPVKIVDIIDETDARDIKTFVMAFKNPEQEHDFEYLPGQFAELSVWGYGECPIGIASSPTEKGTVKFSVKNTGGVVTTALHNLSVGDEMGIRGPLGNYYPVENFKGKNVYIIGGGFAFTTLRSLLIYLLHPDNRDDYGDITVVYGARTPGDLLYREEIGEWQKRNDLELHVTIDKEVEGWDGLVGFVPAIAEQKITTAENAVAVVCGPPIMIKFTIPVLFEAGIAATDIYNSLEMRMKCGIGKCGRCNIGPKYVCKHGPVFTYADLQQLPSEY